MFGSDRCPLTPALLQLLQACVTANSTDTRTLAGTLCRSPETVRTEFKRINQILGTHGRSDALIIAVRNRWIAVSPEG